MTSTDTAHRAGPAIRAIVGLACFAIVLPGFAATPLSDQPLFSNTTVPGNVALALSVEYPTAVRIAHTAAYASTTEFLGYFDPNKCYTYNHGNTEADKYFVPAGSATIVEVTATVRSRTCTNKWSGNFLNWALMQTIDPFRWGMTGGYRVRDEVGLTVLERAWRSTDDTSLSPDRSLPSASLSGATPFSGNNTLVVRTANGTAPGLGNKFRFTIGNNAIGGNTATHYNNQSTGNTLFEAYARVKVCDPSTAAGGVEGNCKRYSDTNWKPEGLIQQYAERMRFSAFGYLNQVGNGRDGGVMRARQKFVGPVLPVPGSAALSNPAAEWDTTTGIMLVNPDTTDAANTNTAYRGAAIAGVTNSGVMNYLNKFGQIYPGTYKSNDPVSEMYYATLRYYRNLGNISRWSDISTGTSDADLKRYLDGFPVIATWDDPIQFSCQRNFVIGIGDINTHADRNVPGNSVADAGNATMPTFSDPWDAQAATNKVGVMQAYQANNPLGTFSSGRSNGFLMAGLAYLANTGDIRTDDATVPKTVGRQSVQTYWVDVLETGFAANNQFYLAAKYGGFDVPSTMVPWDLNRTSALDNAWWYKTTDTVGGQPRPDNYFTAGSPDVMVAGLTKLFAKIASELRAYSTSFSLAAPQVEATGSFSYSSRYDASNWTGEITASSTVFDATSGQPTTTTLWNVSDRIATQFAGEGWDTARRVVTRNSANAAAGGVAFRYNNLSDAQKAALDTAYRTGTDGTDYLNYLRGSRANEMNAVTPANRFYRTRTTLLGDIVGSKARPVGPPNLGLSDSTNAGYSAFRTTRASRPVVVYAAANDGMLHAFRGATASAAANEGQELFAYVPSATFSGPTGTPQVNGLASLGNPEFVHHNLVNATPQVYDVDLMKTDGATPTLLEPTRWRSILIGGMGKGGKSYYALDVTDPSSWTDENAVAGKVLWEFTDPDLGYTYGEPAVIKTKRYGWVVILASGYNNASGVGHFFIVNPSNGALLQKISTGFGSTSVDAGLAHVNTFVNDRTDATADAAYAGDLHGNVWRLDLRSIDRTVNYPVTKIGVATQAAAANSAVQPITVRPRIEVSLVNGKRYVLFGTGRLLDDTDVASTQMQSFYGLWDGTNDSFNVDAAYFPILRADLAEITDLSTGLATASASAKGWYYDLGRGDSGIAWRIISDPAVDAPGSLVGFSPMLPNGQACNPGGTSRTYVVNYATGVTGLRTTTDTFLNFTTLEGVVTDFDFYSVGGRLRAIASTDLGGRSSLRIVPASSLGVRLLNWRELKLVD